MKGCILAICLWIAVVGGASACRHAPPTIVTPQGVVAYQTEDAVDALNALQHEAIVLNHAGKLSRPTALQIVRYRRAATSVIDQAIDAGTGCAAAITDASNGLAELQRGLSSSDASTLSAAIGAARTILVALGGAACQS